MCARQLRDHTASHHLPCPSLPCYALCQQAGWWSSRRDLSALRSPKDKSLQGHLAFPKMFKTARLASSLRDSSTHVLCRPSSTAAMILDVRRDLGVGAKFKPLDRTASSSTVSYLEERFVTPVPTVYRLRLRERSRRRCCSRRLNSCLNLVLVFSLRIASVRSRKCSRDSTCDGLRACSNRRFWKNNSFSRCRMREWFCDILADRNCSYRYVI